MAPPFTQHARSEMRFWNRHEVKAAIASSTAVHRPGHASAPGQSGEGIFLSNFGIGSMAGTNRNCWTMGGSVINESKSPFVRLPSHQPCCLSTLVPDAWQRRGRNAALLI